MFTLKRTVEVLCGRHSMWGFFSLCIPHVSNWGLPVFQCMNVHITWTHSAVRIVSGFFSLCIPHVSNWGLPVFQCMNVHITWTHSAVRIVSGFFSLCIPHVSNWSLPRFLCLNVHITWTLCCQDCVHLTYLTLSHCPLLFSSRLLTMHQSSGLASSKSKWKHEFCFWQ